VIVQPAQPTLDPVDVPEDEVRVQPDLGGLWPRLRKSRSALTGLSITLFFAALAILAPVIAIHDPTETNAAAQYLPPSFAHPFGTDGVGFDIYARTIYAARIDFVIAISSVALAIAIGIPLGALAGYATGVVDDLIMRVLDSLQAFPALILAMAVVAALGKSIFLVVAVIAVINFPAYLRLVRAEMKSKKQSLFAESARGVGNSRSRIVLRHLLPNCLDPVLTQAPLNAGWAILVSASLSFIGLGVPVPTPEWGLMINAGAAGIINGRWWVSFFPGVAVVLAVVGLNLLAEGVRDVLDPRRAGL
jgi:peptide/nickel transport system permease protein